MFVIIPLNQFTIANFPSQTITENVKNGAKISNHSNGPTKGAKLTEQLIVPEQNGAKQQLTVAEKYAMPIDSKSSENKVTSLEINESDNEEDIHICGKCRKEFTRYDIFILHKKSCSLRLKRNEKTDNEKPKENTETINIFHKSPSPFIFPSSPAQVNSPTLSDELHPEEQIYQSINEKYKNKTTQNVIQKEIQETSVKNNSEHLLKNIKPIDKDSSDDFAKVSELSENVDNFVNDDICSSGNKEKWNYCSFEGCNYKGRFNKDVVRHYRTHSGAKPWTCEVCDKPFARKDKLSRHMSIHSGEKKYSCIYCPYKTYEKSHLNKHIRIHSGETPYQCKVCPYKSKSSSQLTVHMRKHTGETPFGCSFVGCESTFKTSSDLNRHKQIHAAVKPFSCHICGHKVCFKGNLKTHMAKIHNV